MTNRELVECLADGLLALPPPLRLPALDTAMLDYCNARRVEYPRLPERRIIAEAGLLWREVARRVDAAEGATRQ